MLHRIALVAAAAGAVLALNSLPAGAAPTTHSFRAPSITGAAGWGTYTRTSSQVRLRLCSKDTRRNHLGAVTSASFTDRSGHHYQNAVTYNFQGAGHVVCKDFTSKLTGHLEVMVAIGTRTEPVRFSDPKYVY